MPANITDAKGGGGVFCCLLANRRTVIGHSARQRYNWESYFPLNFNVFFADTQYCCSLASAPQRTGNKTVSVIFFYYFFYIKCGIVPGCDRLLVRLVVTTGRFSFQSWDGTFRINSYNIIYLIFIVKFINLTVRMKIVHTCWYL